MNNDNLVKLSIAELATMIQQKEISPVELTEATLNRIREVNPTVNAYITVMEEEARAYAKLAEQEIVKGQYKGPLHGIPLAIKDNIDTKGVRTTHGSKIHRENFPQKDAPVVTQLLEAGMIPVGKTNMHEYAYGITTVNPHYNPTRNPWNTDKIAGGSSGGSAAALASHMTIAALGTDTAGSIRIPSACCGTVGLKPTFGRVSKKGVFPLSWTLDHVGPMTKNVQDASYMLHAMDSNPSSQNYGDLTIGRSDLKGVKIGIPQEEAYFQLETSVKNRMNEVIDHLRELGAEIRYINIPTLVHVPFVSLVTYAVEASAIHHQKLLSEPEHFGADVRTLLKFGETLTGVQYMQAQQLRRIISGELESVFESVHSLLLPTIPIPAPTINEMQVVVNGEEVNVTEALLRLPQIANVCGLPSLAVPSGISDTGLPVGIQLIGKAFDEQMLINIGFQLEQKFSVLGKIPELKYNP
jgi:aspartyl-tRNA(Asn)/glutamyl-tRNA(Gln) amidotransferase subunit A